ncbi:MAG: DEAD/DEAH box helicase family protein, partial [Brevundimonas sp.]
MTRLAPFQRATVKAATACLQGPGTRRFLVADEVGLGKTLIAREVAAELKGKRSRFNVLYLCPSLEIAGQNRSKFVSLTGIDEKDYIGGEDRLSLVPLAPPMAGKGFSIFSFTPETSLPGWKPGPRTGRKTERALIRTLISPYPRLSA